MNDTDRLASELRARERAIPTSRLGRLWRTGRNAAGLARAALASRRDGAELTDGERASIEALVGRVGELKGLAMKAGQMLGYIDATLSPDLRRLLSVLQTSSPASPWPAVEATITSALGERAPALLAGLEQAPFAVASIGQVHRGLLPDGTEVAVKVRHPGVEQALRADLATAGVGPTFARLFGAGVAASARTFVDEARAAFLEECDFTLEAERQAGFAARLDDPDLEIPAVELSWSAPAVLTTRWRPGLALEAFAAAAPQQARDRAGVALFRFYVRTLYRDHLFHADPHPGNYAFTPDGRVIVYDFGCVRRYDAALVAALRALAFAVRRDDAGAIDAALRGLGASPPVDADARAHLRELLRGFFAPLLAPGARAIAPGAALDGASVMRDKRALMKLQLPGALLFLFRVRFGLYAVLARLGAVADWAALEAAWASEAE